MSRRTDRKHIFNLVFQIEFNNGVKPEELLSSYFDTLNTENEKDLIELAELVDDREFIKFSSIEIEFVRNEFLGAFENREDIDRTISKYSEGWSLERLSKIDLALLRLAVYEVLFTDDIPAKAAINEAVELSKIYSTDEAPAFVNGILARVINEKKRQE